MLADSAPSGLPRADLPSAVMAVDMAKRKLTFKERLNLELMLRIGAGGIHAAADIQGILDADRRVNPATKQPASERVRFAVAGLNADGRQATVATVKYFLKNHGMPAAIKRVLRGKRQSEEKATAVSGKSTSRTSRVARAGYFMVARAAFDTSVFALACG
jgi:hypothetical protein